MAKLAIPYSLKPIIEKIGSLSNSEFRKIEDVLASISPSLDSSTGNEDTSEFIRAIVNMSMARGELAVAQFSKDIVAALKRKNDLPKGFSEEVFASRMERIFGYESLMLSAKGIDVQQENDAVFISSKIISDIRPIFDSSGSDPIGALVIHNIKITYHQNHDHKELFISLDNADLVALRKVLDRAEKKTAALNTLIKKTGLKHLKAKQK